MNNSVQVILGSIAWMALGAILMWAYHHDNAPFYVVDWRNEGKIISTSVNGDVFYTIKTDKGDFDGIDFDTNTHLKKFSFGKSLYKLYVVKRLEYPNLNMGEIDIEYTCSGSGCVLDGGTLVSGSINW